MKKTIEKRIIGFILVFALLFGGFTGNVEANTSTTPVYYESNIELKIDGQKVNLPEKLFYYERELMVPIKEISPLLKLSLLESQNGKFILKNNEIELTFKENESKATFKFKEKNMEVLFTAKPIKINNKIYIEISSLNRFFGFKTVRNSTDITIFSQEKNILPITKYPISYVRENIYKSSLEELGELTTSKERILEISKKGNALELMKDEIKSVLDFLLMLETLDFEVRSGDTQIKNGSITWHYNLPPKISFKIRKVNCGAISNLANYLLNDDYEEMGFINYTSIKEGGHIVNYFKKDGNEFVIDFLDFFRNNPFLDSKYDVNYLRLELIDGKDGYMSYMNHLMSGETYKNLSILVKGIQKDYKDFITGDNKRDTFYFTDYQELEVIYLNKDINYSIRNPNVQPNNWNIN